MNNKQRIGIAATAASALLAGAIAWSTLSATATASDSALELAAAETTVENTRETENHPRLAALRWRGIHGEATVKTRDGDFDDYAWQRGSVTAASATSLTVKSDDGTSWAWTVDGKTRVRKDGAKSEIGKIVVGDHAFVVGPVTGEKRTVTIVVVPKKR